MPKRPRQNEVTLADLRRELDRIDAAMHALLMERGETIDTLIAVKKTQESGSAFHMFHHLSVAIVFSTAPSPYRAGHPRKTAAAQH